MVLYSRTLLAFLNFHFLDRLFKCANNICNTQIIFALIYINSLNIPKTAIFI